MMTITIKIVYSTLTGTLLQDYCMYCGCVFVLDFWKMENNDFLYGTKKHIGTVQSNVFVVGLHDNAHFHLDSLYGPRCVVQFVGFDICLFRPLIVVCVFGYNHTGVRTGPLRH